MKKLGKGLSRREVLATGLAVSGGLLLPALGVLGFPGRAGAAAKEISTDLLIVGAGPFGLALAAYAREHGIRHQVLGAEMGFWRDNMPEGMLLRSTCDWSLDPLGIHTIDAYLAQGGKQCRDVEPLSRGFYLDYAAWFQEEKSIVSSHDTVSALIRDGSDLVAIVGDGRHIRSRAVVLALGFGYFAHLPPELASMFPRDRYGHTCDFVDFRALEGKRVLIIGGRQSAFEWTALIREAGAEAVHVSYRHDTPQFTTSDWSWVNELVDRIGVDPGWYRRLSPDEKQQLNRRFWEEGRLKLEPWLAGRIDHTNVHLHPHSNVEGTNASDAGIDVRLDNGDAFTVDRVVFATGYRVDLSRVPLLANGLLPDLAVRDGFPELDTHFQTNVPGLYITSLAATRDFGSFLGFTVSVRAQARVIGEAVRGRLVESGVATAHSANRLSRRHWVVGAGPSRIQAGTPSV
jgi:cation diffusion facilitator CzcD-associated flavoprotein CzcO